MTTDDDLRKRVEELEREADLGWNIVFLGLPLAILFDVLDRRGRERRAQRRREAQARFEGWIDGLGHDRREDLHATLEAGLPLPSGASPAFRDGFVTHNDLMRSLVREEAERHAIRGDDARELLEGAGLSPDLLSVEWLRGFQAANRELATRFGPPQAVVLA